MAERFRKLFEQLPEALLVVSAEGRIRDANAAAGDLYRCDPDELIGRGLAELSDDVAELSDELAATGLRARLAGLDEGRNLDLSGVGRRLDGSLFPHQVTIARDPADESGEAFAIVRDLSERQTQSRGLAGLADLARLEGTEGSLHMVAARAVKLSSLMLDADRAALCATQGDTTVEWLANHRLEHLIAASSDLRPSQIPWLTRALATGQPELIDRRRPEHARSALSAAADQLGVAAFAIVPLRSGDELTGALGLVWSGDPPELASDLQLLATIGQLIGLALGNVRLRDSLLARQDALDESEARYRNLFEQAPEPILICDWDGRILDANGAASALYGRKRRDLLARGLDDIAELRRDERGLLMSGLRRRRRGVARVRGRRADGSTFPQTLEIAVTAVRGQERLLVQVRDLTDQERMQAELLQAQKMEALGQLISGVAHELNNPLSAIVAFGQLLHTDERLPPDLTRDADLLVQEAERTRRIVQNLLDFARQRTPERQPADLRMLVERTLELHSYALGAGRIVATLDIPDDLPPVHIDPNQIHQVLLNLTLNAIQAIRSVSQTGSIHIAARAIGQGPADAVRLSIHDDGPGVSPHVQPHLFEPFFTTKDVGQGTGLGLSVSYGIVAAHGGRLWFEPARTGGATFLLELPTRAQPEPAADGASGRDARGVSTVVAASLAGRRRDARILAVDDEPAVRVMLKRALVRAGYDVAVAASGAEALDRIGDEDFDLLLIDHRMSGMDGIETYNHAVALRPEMRRRVLIMSGDALNPALRDFAVANGLRMLAKPFDLAMLISVVDEELGGPARETGDPPAQTPAQSRG